MLWEAFVQSPVGYRSLICHRPCYRTTIAHFLNHGKWNGKQQEDMLKSPVPELIYAQCFGQPLYYIVDDTISSKAKPSSQALHPIENAYFHQSHLKRKQKYGHQAVAVMLTCNGIIPLSCTINYVQKSRLYVTLPADRPRCLCCLISL